MKQTGTLSGLFLGLLSIFGAFLIEGGSMKALFLLAPIMIVFGGTFSATIIGFGLDGFLKIFTLARLAYFPLRYNFEKLVNDLVELSIISRRDGVLAVDKHLNTMDHLFTRKIIRYVIDGNDETSLRSLANIEMRSMQDRHFSNIFIFTKMGGYAPTMGILGTVMGLIMTLTNVGDDPNLLIRNIASAFIATLWGVFTANLLWLPIGDKLKQCHLEEKRMMEISLEAALALRTGEIPSLTKARLVSMLPQKDQVRILNLST